MPRLDFCKAHPNACLENNIGRINPYNTLAQPSLFPESITKERGAFSRSQTSYKSNELGKDLRRLASSAVKGLTKSIRVGKLSKEKDLQELEDMMFLVSNKRDVEGYELIGEGKKFRVYTNPEEGKMRITFEGARGTPADNLNVKNVIKNKPIVGEDVKEEEAFLAELFKNGTKKIHFEGNDYTDIKLIGHSLGGYKARKYGAEYDVPVELLNAHVMPWNTFEETTAPVNFHTIITDPVDMKFLLQPKDNITHTYYQPLEANELAFARQRLGETAEPSVLDPHYDVSFQNLDREEQSAIAETIKTKYPEMIGNTVAGGLALAGSIYNASTDPNYDPRTDPMLGSAGESGMIGLNLDPDYEWKDSAPPSGGFDWLIWKTLNPLAKEIASSSNPDQLQSLGEQIEREAGSTLTSPLYTFEFQGEEYYYQKDSNGNPIWFSEGGPLSQDIKDAYEAQRNEPAPASVATNATAVPFPEEEADFTEMPF